jgi:hypothetical protein
MSVDRIAAWASSLVVAATVLAGLWLGGSPDGERLRRLDERRVQDLQQIARTLEGRARREGALPETPAALVDGLRLDGLPTDPVSGRPYRYERLAPDRFRLCADFAARSSDGPDTFWDHGNGPACFEFDVSLETPGASPVPR